MNRVTCVTAGLLIAALSVSGCYRETTEVSALLNVKMPQGNFVFTGVTVDQGGELITAEPVPSEPLRFRMEVEVGVPVNLSALILDSFDDPVVPGLYAFSGDQTYTAEEPGEQPGPVQLTVTEQPSALITVTPRFNGTDAWSETLSLNVTDVATGTVITDAFDTSIDYEVPANRVLRAEGTHPYTGAFSTGDFTPDGSGGANDNVDVDVGSPPALPNDNLPSNGSEIVSDDVGADTTVFSIECAFGLDCATAIDADFEPCDQMSFASDLETSYTVAVRYAEIENTCVDKIAQLDRTPAEISVDTSPAFLLFGDDPTDVTFDIYSNEPLRAERTRVLHIDATQTETELPCGNATQTGSPVGVQCTGVDISGISGGDSPTPVPLIVEVFDLAGNPTKLATTIVNLSNDASSVVAVTAFDPIPQVPSPFQNVFPAVIEVTRVSNKTLCNVGFSDIQINPFLEYDVAYDSTVLPELSAPDRSHYFSAVISRSGQASGPPQPGTYTASITLALEVADDPPNDCTSATFAFETFDVPFEIDYAPMRFITDDDLNISTLHYWDYPNLGAPATSTPHNWSQAFLYPIRGGTAAPATDFPSSFTFDIAPASAADTCSMSETDWQLNPGAAGDLCTLTLDNVDPDLPAGFDGSDAIRVRTWPAPSVVMLQQNSLTEAETGEGVVTPTGVSVGGAQQVLWESTRNAIIVVGAQDVQLDDTSETNPCAAADIIGAGFTAAAPAHDRAQPDLALLVSDGSGGFTHCEIDPSDGTELHNIPLPQLGAPGTSYDCTPTTFVTDPITNRFYAIGESTLGEACAFAYDRASSAVVEVDGFDTRQAFSLNHRAAKLDPFGNYITSLSDSDGLGLLSGPRLDPRNGDYSPECELSASEINLRNGELLLAHWADGTQPAGCFIPNRQVELGLHREWEGAGEGNEDGSIRDDFLGAGTTERITAMAIDHGHARAYLGREDGTYEVADLDNLSSYHNDSVANAATDGGPVLDMVVRGPQPLWFSRELAMAGDFVTVVGVGFSGGIDDHVYINGIEATVHGASTTAITFEIPAAFDASDRPFFGLWVTVMSHGIMSGPTPDDLFLTHDRVGYSFSPADGGPHSSPCTALSGSCFVSSGMLAPGPNGDLLSTDEQVGLAIGVGADFGSGFWIDIFGPSNNPTNIVSLRGRLRAIGGHMTAVGGPAYYEARLTEPNAGSFDSARSYPISGPGVPIAPAISPDETTFVHAQNSNEVAFRWATTLAPHPAYGDVNGVLQVGLSVITDLAFSQDGSVLWVAGTDSSGLTGVVEPILVSPTGLTTPGVTVQNFIGCPEADSVTIGLSGDGPDDEATLVNFDDDGADPRVINWSLRCDPAGVCLRTCLGEHAIPALNTATFADVSPLGDIVAFSVVNSSFQSFMYVIDRDTPSLTWFGQPIADVTLDLMFGRDGEVVHTLGEFDNNYIRPTPYPVVPFGF